MMLRSLRNVMSFAVAGSRTLVHCDHCQTLTRTGKAAVFSQNHVQHISYGSVLRCSSSSMQTVTEQVDTTVEDTEVSQEFIDSLGPADQRRLKIMQLEFDVFASTGSLVPACMTDDQWKYILEKCKSYTSRRKQYSYWFKLDHRIRNDAKKKKERQRRHQEKMAELEQQKMDGTLVVTNKITLRIIERTKHQHYYHNLAHAMVHGIPLVYDLSYDQHMDHRELVALTDQILMAYGCNKIHPEPFHMVLANAHPDSYFMKHVSRTQILDLQRVPITITDKPCMELFPKKDLVYLSPNAPEVLRRFDAHAVYVVGGIVDKRIEEPLTFARAKRDRVRCARLPLDQQLDWGAGSKSLTLNQIMEIMLELKMSNDWEKAFSFVPRRKLRKR